jgi:RNA polymerase sigma-70 factor (ECF subfamily)
VRMNEEKERFWEVLKPEYNGGLVFCRKLLGDRDSGDDLFQEALVISYQRFSDLRDESAFRPWFFRIIVNCFKMKVRRPWFKRRVNMSPQIENRLIGRNPEGQLNARRWLQQAFKSVSTDDQALITLHELDGWSVADLAELHSVSESAIKTRLFRARGKLKKALGRGPQPIDTHTVSRSADQEGKCVAAKPSLD